MWEIALLMAAAFCAGVVNSVAGGGTLLTFPSLLAVLSPVQANATSTFALLPGTLAAGWGYRDEVSRVRRHLVRLWPSSLIGGTIGSLLVIRLPEKVFAGLVPWLLVTASVLMLVQRPLSRWIGHSPHKEPSPVALLGIVVFQFFVGVYGGYFGAGIGILMLSALAFAGISDIHEMNGVKSLLGSTINSITIVVFILSGIVIWKYAVPMAFAGMAGGYTGARVARRLPGNFIRAVVICVGFGVAAFSWWSQSK